MLGLLLVTILPQLNYRRQMMRPKYKSVRFRWELLSHSFLHFFYWRLSTPGTHDYKLHREVALLGVRNGCLGIIGWIVLLTLGVVFIGKA